MLTAAFTKPCFSLLPYKLFFFKFLQVASSSHLVFCVPRNVGSWELHCIFRNAHDIIVHFFVVYYAVEWPCWFFFSFHFTQQGLLILIQVTPKKSSYLIFFLWRLYSWGYGCIMYVCLSDYNYCNKQTPCLLRIK